MENKLLITEYGGDADIRISHLNSLWWLFRILCEEQDRYSVMPVPGADVEVETDES